MLMLASTIQFSNNTHHHTATSYEPHRAHYAGADTQQQNREDVSSQTPNSVPTKPPTTSTSRPRGDKNYRVSVPPNNMSDRQTTNGFDTALNAP